MGKHPAEHAGWTGAERGRWDWAAVGGRTAGEVGRWDHSGPPEPQQGGALSPGRIRVESWLRVGALTPGFLGLNPVSAFCQLSDLGQVALALCASVSSFRKLGW